MSGFCNEKSVIARKDHHCCECNNGIKKGDQHTVYSGFYDGEAFRERMCHNCDELLTYVIDSKVCESGEFQFGSLWECLDGMDAIRDDGERQRAVSATNVPHEHILNMR